MLALNATAVQVSWTAVSIPLDGTLMGYRVYYQSAQSITTRHLNDYSQFFPAGVTLGVIGGLVYYQTYRFSVTAEVSVNGQSYTGNVSLSGADSPIINPGNSHLMVGNGCKYGTFLVPAFIWVEQLIIIASSHTQPLL